MYSTEQNKQWFGYFSPIWVPSNFLYCSILVETSWVLISLISLASFVIKQDNLLWVTGCKMVITEIQEHLYWDWSSEVIGSDKISWVSNNILLLFPATLHQLCCLFSFLRNETVTEHQPSPQQLDNHFWVDYASPEILVPLLYFHNWKGILFINWGRKGNVWEEGGRKWV